jgi:hypothetical protein
MGDNDEREKAYKGLMFWKQIRMCITWIDCNIPGWVMRKLQVAKEAEYWGKNE